MATFDSIQMAKLNAVPVQHVRSDEHGRIRAAIFEWESAATPAAADTINLCKLPPGARVLGGEMWWEINTATATFVVGIAGATTKYSGTNAPLLTATPVTTPAVGGYCGYKLAGTGSGGTIAARVLGEVQASSITVIGTVGVATLAASKRIFGIIYYLGVE
jgi:hypothetical protein